MGRPAPVTESTGATIKRRAPLGIGGSRHQGMGRPPRLGPDASSELVVAKHLHDRGLRSCDRHPPAAQVIAPRGRASRPRKRKMKSRTAKQNDKAVAVTHREQIIQNKNDAAGANRLTQSQFSAHSCPQADGNRRLSGDGLRQRERGCAQSALVRRHVRDQAEPLRQRERCPL